MKSIFEIERRKSFESGYERFIADLEETQFTDSLYEDYTMAEYLDYCIRYWPYRCGAICIKDYLTDINIDSSFIETDEQRFIILELYLNLLHWAPYQDTKDSQRTALVSLNKSNVITEESKRLIINLEYILEQCCNMRVREEDGEKAVKYFITKRNSVVDATVEMVPELSNVLLGYLDIRNEKDVIFKKRALETIYAYMEPRRNEYKGLACRPISEEFFACMNSLGIRHNTEKQVTIPNRKRIMVFDKLFKMALYVLQTEKVNLACKEVRSLRASSKA